MKNKILILSLAVTLVLILGSCSASKSGQIPNNLATIEAQAEEIIDVTPGGNWKTINADIETISAAWKIYQPQALKDGATQAMLDTFDSAFSHLQMAASEQDKLNTMQASNDISVVVVDLFDLYHPSIPADVGRLDVLERQVVLDASAGNFSGVKVDLAKINDVWAVLKPSVSAHKGEEVVSQFEKSLSVQAKALGEEDIEKLTDEAGNALEIVDAMERLY